MPRCYCDMELRNVLYAVINIYYELVPCGVCSCGATTQLQLMIISCSS